MTCSKNLPKVTILKVLALLTLVVAVFTLACSDATPTPLSTQIVLPTATISGTSTPSTPTPTNTPLSILTPTPVLSLSPIVLTDSNGEFVVLPEPPERIVSIGSAAVEILFELGEGHRIVGTHDFVSYPPETADIDKIGSAFALDIEKIAALEPDLLYTFFESPVADLERLGVPILYLENPKTLEGVAERIRTWGELVGKQEAGVQLAQRFDEAIDTIKGRLASITNGPRIYHDEAPGFWTTGSDSLANEVYTLLKAENTFGDISEYAQVSAEQIVERDPEVIISVYGDGPDSFSSAPAFRDISAVKNDRLYAIDGDLLTIAGPRLVEGMELLAGLFYPELAP